MFAIGAIGAIIGMSCLMDEETFGFGALLSVVSMIVLVLECI